MQTQVQQSFFPTLFQVSQPWKKAKKDPQVKTMLKSFPTELVSRMEKAQTDEASKQAIIKAGWAKEQAGKLLWMFQTWDAEAKKETPDPCKTPLPQEAVKEKFQLIASLLNAETVQRFHATRPLAAQSQDQSVCFMIEIAHRKQNATTLCARLSWSSPTACCSI